MTTPAGASQPLADSDGLPLTQHLVMEVLAARYRLGEGVWTFTDRTRQAMRSLEAAGYIGYKSGIVERTFLAWLTPAGKAAAMSQDYRPPTSVAVWCDWCRAEEHQACEMVTRRGLAPCGCTHPAHANAPSEDGS